MGYAARLSGDARRWRDLGIIDASQEARILATALDGGAGRTQVAMVLCAAACAAAAAVAFTASNWASMGAASRLLVLLIANAVAVSGACWAKVRHDEGRGRMSGALSEGLALLSLVVSAASVALVGQTFHVDPDPRGYALTVAAVGAVTACVSRSGAAALLGCIALFLGAGGFAADITSPAGAGTSAGPWYWVVAASYAALVLTGRARAGSSVSLVLMASVVVMWAGGGIPSGRMVLPALVAVTAVGIAGGHLLSTFGRHLPWASDFAGEAFARGAAGLALAAILLVTTGAGGLDDPWGMTRGYVGPASWVWLLAAVVALALPRLTGKGPLPAAHLAVLGALAFSMAAYLAARTGHSVVRPVRGALGATVMVWTGILPCLALVVAAHVEERRALFWASVAATAGLSLWLLASSSDLVGLSFGLLGLATVFGLSVLAGRFLSDHRMEAVR